MKNPGFAPGFFLLFRSKKIEMNNLRSEAVNRELWAVRSGSND